ncbi:AAA family ATPase, partial [Candidatus Pacearchaeota archaeon]|nr:AAA family ATPase [Candidatus Pacearchaeota archaeon]
MVNKTFQVATWGDDNEGEKIIMYADSGMGKTTLASMLPTPTFAGLDDGGRKIRHPVTDEKLKNIPGIETFSDFRMATQQPDLFNDYETLVVHTGNILEGWALDWMLQNVAGEKGTLMKNIEQYGWGKGYRHLYDTMRLPLADFDALI